MKKILTTLLLISMVLSVAGCGTSVSGATEDESINASEYPKLLVKKVWKHPVITCATDEKCTQLLYLSTFGKCCYYEGCGKGVGESLSYKNYSYDEDTGMITVYGEDKTVEVGQMKIIRYDDKTLLLQTDMGVTEFYYEGAAPSVAEECREYMTDYSSYCKVVELKGNSVMIGATHYSGNTDELAEDKLASDVQIYMLDIQTLVKGSTETSTHTYTEISKDELGQIIGDEPSVAFVWYNDNLEVEKIVCYKVTRTIASV